MRFSPLSDKTLLYSFQEAKKIEVNPDFIKLLEAEIKERGLLNPHLIEQKLKRIN
ncbi:sporulation histidine kinase inhibitor Sda [Metabacillus halosaccharovorans]|uniref:Sporulation histidine kinase inhibitor Sda n=1 Tax=Metabacillus halosaccharovorans TaxID=930124 RepID=A0ABT3DJJ7_9BACI|nr:sporulation histidine kinase inhibitor Sda [Metabacillus halosaccharovorans]MCV9887227.1 sporulation histidine kinase inhibitor Sda [Metabacillus halosaccharovorans]